MKTEINVTTTFFFFFPDSDLMQNPFTCSFKVLIIPEMEFHWINLLLMYVSKTYLGEQLFIPSKDKA